MRLLVGLGNPGPTYALSRHNAGAQFVQRVSDQYGTLRYDTKFSGQVGNVQVGTEDVRLYIPAAYMNECGRGIAGLARFYKLAATQVLVAHDDLELPPGTVRLKSGGGHGGHNGLRDLIRHLGSNEFSRLRIGIGHPGSPDQVSDYVLRKPSRHESKLIEDSIDAVQARLPAIVEGNDCEFLMSGYGAGKQKGKKR